MPTTYSDCGSDVVQIADRLKRKFYSDLLEADVAIHYLFAASNGDAPALMHHGWPAAALIKINNRRDRVQGLADATLMLDGRAFADWDQERRVAVIDHELYHLEVKRTKFGAVATDDAGRPKVKLKPHDFEIAGFHAMVDRHGLASMEAQNFVHVAQHWRQMAFNFEGASVS